MVSPGPGRCLQSRVMQTRFDAGSQARHHATQAVAHLHWFTYRGPSGRAGQVPRRHARPDPAVTSLHERTRRRDTGLRGFLGCRRERNPSVRDLPTGWNDDLGDCRSTKLAAAQRRIQTFSAFFQEDQVLDVVRSEPMRIDRVSDIRLTVKGELADVLAATSASALW